MVPEDNQANFTLPSRSLRRLGPPAAVDLESKFSEAGLGGVMLADYRNFAHGRHNWIDKRGEESTVIAFITPESAALAERTLQLLPSTTRVLEFKTKTPGPAGGLELILHAFRYTAFVGKQRGIDPGRPGVPAYGSRIFHLGPVVYTKCRRASNLAQLQAAAVNRKQAARGTLDDEDDRSRVTQAFATYSARLQEAKFGSLVVDFDGTVVGSGATNGPLPPAIIAFFTKLLKRHVTIYFATGRGDSIHCILQASFPSSLWDRLYISYYNGVLTLPFTESSSFDEGNLPANPALDLVFKIMQQDSLLTKLTKLNRANHKHCQIAIKVAASSSVSVVSALVRDIVAENACTALRVVQCRQNHPRLLVADGFVVAADRAVRPLWRRFEDGLVAAIGERVHREAFRVPARRSVRRGDLERHVAEDRVQGERKAGDGARGIMQFHAGHDLVSVPSREPRR